MVLTVLPSHGLHCLCWAMLTKARPKGNGRLHRVWAAHQALWQQGLLCGPPLLQELPGLSLQDFTVSGRQRAPLAEYKQELSLQAHSVLGVHHEG